MASLVRFYKLSERARVPTRGTAYSAAYDLYASEDTVIPPYELGVIGTGLVMEYEPDWTALITLRSSTPKRMGLLIPHGYGLIDRDYCGPEDELLISVYNFRREPCTVFSGDRIAQILFVRSELPGMTVIEGPPEKNRVRGGFGSTGP